MINHFYEGLQVLESEAKPLSPIERLKAINGPLLSWYDSHARVLPWREMPEAYRVWISEIMLQQTRVEAVKPYYARFMEALPDVKALAEVEDERLMKLWEGLGYYNRARNLKKAAGVIMSDNDGQIPETYEELLKLPGIGSYTAGAISSIAFGHPVPAVDGNVLRVLSRVLESHEDILKQSVKKHFEELLRETMPKERTSAFTQGMIEIGAIVCVPNGKPRCEECPLESLCLAKRHGLLDSIPYKAPKKPRKIEEKTVLLICSSKKTAIRKRPDQGLLASLYEFPNTDHYLTADEVREYLEKEQGVTVESVEPLGNAKHIFSHVEWHMNGYLVCTNQIPGQYLAVGRQELQNRYAIPNAFQAYYQKLMEVLA